MILAGALANELRTKKISRDAAPAQGLFLHIRNRAGSRRAAPVPNSGQTATGPKINGRRAGWTQYSNSGGEIGAKYQISKFWIGHA